LASGPFSYRLFWSHVLRQPMINSCVRVPSSLQPTRKSSSTHSLSAAKVWWLELSQLSLCSAFNKENSIESLLDLLYYIYNYYCGYAPCLLQSLCPSADFFVTLLWLWPFLWPQSHLCDSVTIMWYFSHSTLVII